MKRLNETNSSPEEAKSRKMQILRNICSNERGISIKKETNKWVFNITKGAQSRELMKEPHEEPLEQSRV